ncbi:run domain Beclin-1-interacting and cysteine-rich domain-containing protein isoform X2 [Microcaecilia unicolor]|uniref:Run domain Beclin-1-interacting and cysteine-rich domain-containing protein isoform X2 n=1 Tax=Microcaecilia unicolor TaxID=1415580 RepID=A0A6P7Z3H1_9AMPH|nr:run domain Beclin-1-interacting and cysteine-rich domain-containing protein isoform X2 [Microcaecilia unicolor]
MWRRSSSSAAVPEVAVRQTSSASEEEAAESESVRGGRRRRRMNSKFDAKEHWKLLGNLKTTVEGLVSTNNPNVWSKYGGLDRLCRDMNNILYHGLIQDKVYCKEQDYWRFVKDIRWISPHASQHMEKFISSQENGQKRGDGVNAGDTAQLWLQHSLQFHCLSAQLRALLGNRQYTRKFYTDTAFLLSDDHVRAMFQCLEAVEQNNPKLLAQIDASVFARKSETFSSMMKSQSLTALPGSLGLPPLEYSQHRFSGSFSSLQQQSSSGPGTDWRTALEVPKTTGSIHPQENTVYKVCVSVSEDRLAADSSAVPAFSTHSPKDPFSPLSEMSVSTLTSQSEDPWAGSQDDTQSEADDGPEYLAIGNLRHRRRTSSQSSGSSKSSASDLFSSSSSQKPDSLGHSTSAGRSSSLLSLLRRSSFSEGQTSTSQGGTRKSHTRSHSDTSVASGKGHESCSDTLKLKDHISCTSQSSGVHPQSSLYMEQEGPQYLTSGEGMFRRPSKGQSLISYLSEQDFGSCADLEKENAHFSISESLIAAIELMKCNMISRQLREDDEDDDSDKEIQELKQKIRMRRKEIQTKRNLPIYGDPESESFTATESGSQFSSRDSMRLSDSGSVDEVDEYEIRDADIKRGGTLSSRSTTTSSISHSFLHSNSAEAVAMGLLKQFEGMQLPAASELEWLVPEHDAPQKLLPIPNSLPISPDDGEHADIYKLRIRVRGNLEWAPPRPQIIFNTHKAPTRKVAVAKQNYRCAGCGIRTDPDYIKRMRYCEYLGKYFCQCCHENAQMIIPGRILHKWDFSKYYVSNFSKDLLTKIWNDPLFNVQDINGALYRKVKALDQVRVLRIQLVDMKNMFKTCRLAKELLDVFDTIPGHLTEDLHLYSLNDLSDVKRGDLSPCFKELLKAGVLHVEKCVLCQAKGFICEFCQDEEIIFPFELNKCRRCEECKACFHRSCFKTDHCPRCDRLRARRELLTKENIESYISDHEEVEAEELVLSVG